LSKINPARAILGAIAALVTEVNIQVKRAADDADSKTDTAA
jgi:hypothetical protein